MTLEAMAQLIELELDPADGQQYIVELRDRLIELLNSDQTIKDVEERINNLYPNSVLVAKAIEKAEKSRTDTSKAHKSRQSSSSSSFTDSLVHSLSVAKARLSRAGHHARDGLVGSKGDNELTKFKTAFIEYIIDDVLKLAGEFVKRQNNFIITKSDIRTAMHIDRDLLDIFLSDDKSFQITKNHSILAHFKHQSNNHQLLNMNYKQKVRNMVDSENSFIRSLQLIIKVFKAQLIELFEKKSENREERLRDVKIIFCNVEELLELSTSLLTILEDALESVGQEDGIPYVGSEIFDLAQAEEFHAYFTFAYRRLSRAEPSLWRQAYLNIIGDEQTMFLLRTIDQSFQSLQSFDLAVKHLLPKYLLMTIIQFSEYFKNISDLYELSKRHKNQDDESALKETISILIKTKRAIEELLETELDSNEIESLNCEETEKLRSTLDKRLNQLLEDEKSMPLPFMPPPEIYRFSEPDTENNIQFEPQATLNRDRDRQMRPESDQIPVIRCATVIKLVERLTYHKYQPNIVDSFLTTYRSFISDPEELLNLLIERFKIPDPPLEVVYPCSFGSQDNLSETERLAYKHYLKRFRQEYSKPVKMRVINVLKSWIKEHYYDFEDHPKLLDKLHLFLDEVHSNDKVLRSLIVSIRKSIEQKSVKDDGSNKLDITLSSRPPEILWHSVEPHETDKYDILTLHPHELARQLTLIQFEMFRAIKPREVVKEGDKMDKDECPNSYRLSKNFTFFSLWIRTCILEEKDFERRAAIFNRAIEIMGFLRKLNNFTGLLSIGCAIESTPIKRLPRTTNSKTSTTIKIMDDYSKLCASRLRGIELELKCCNPPCIPYLGAYRTKAVHTEGGNKTFVDHEIDTTSPTLSNDGFHSSMSNSPATPISPKTPLPLRTSSTLPPSASSTRQDQFFGTNIHTRPSTTPTTMSNFGFPPSSGCNNHHCNGNHQCDCGSNRNSNNGTCTLMRNQNPPTTPAPQKMVFFFKQRIRAGLWADIKSYQNPPYCLNQEPRIQNFILNIEVEMPKYVASLEGSTGLEKDYLDANVAQNFLDKYQHEQSKRLEPSEDCTKLSKPSKSKQEWKSPGIKGNTLTLQR